MNLRRARFKAKRIEDEIRERAFLPVGETINDVEVLQFNLGHLHRLFHAGSPFFYGGIRQIGDVGLFLWIVSPHYDGLNPEIRREWWWVGWRVWRRLTRRGIPTVREIFLAQLIRHPRWHLFYRAIDRYIDRAFMDRPPTIGEGGKIITASYMASVLHKLMRTYGGRPEDWMDTPMAAIFQLMKWIDVEDNPKTPQFTPLQSRIELTADRLQLRHG